MKNLMNKATAKAKEVKAAVFGADKGGKEIIVELGLTVVAVALIVSYTISRALASVTADSNMVEVNITMKDTLVTATALLMACFEMVL